MGFLIAIGIVQLALYVFCVILFFPVAKISVYTLRQRMNLDVVFTLIALACIYCAARSFPGLFPVDGFFGYISLILVGLFCYWLVKHPYFMEGNNWVTLIVQGFIAVLFFLGCLSMLKFHEALLLIVFPGFGLMVAAPFLVAWMAFCALVDAGRRHGRANFVKSFLTGISFLVLFQLLMNLWTDEPWALTKMFTPIRGFMD